MLPFQTGSFTQQTPNKRQNHHPHPKTRRSTVSGQMPKEQTSGASGRRGERPGTRLPACAVRLKLTPVQPVTPAFRYPSLL